MLDFTDVGKGLPKNNEYLVYIVKCPEWNDTGYTVCFFKQGRFQSLGQEDASFMNYVTSWAFLADTLEELEY